MANINSALVKAAVDALTARVNGVLGAASDGVSAAALALDYRDTTLTYKQQAEAAALQAQGYAGDVASAIVYQDLAAIAVSKGINMVDACIDVSPNPSLAVQMATSWYNEPLNTATRGARRELPTRKIEIASSNSITILDGDDPALPMWKVIPSTSGSGYISDGYGQDISSIASENGVIVVGLLQSSTSDAGTYGGGLIFDFGNDTTEKLGGKLTAFSKSGKKSGITSDQSGYLSGGGRHLVNGRVNSVTMTVLPDAPIDPVSGLQVPTIAFGTDGGLTQIGWDGFSASAVWNLSATIGSNFDEIGSIEFVGDKIVYIADIGYNDKKDIIVLNILTDNVTGYDLSSTSSEQYNYRSEPVLTGSPTEQFGHLATDNKILFLGSGTGFRTICRNPSEKAKGMIAHVTSSYNTGWMAGGCLGAFMCSTDTASLVGSGELVTNGTFDVDTSGWGVHPSGDTTLSVVSGRLRVTIGPDGSSYPDGARQQITGLVVGASYKVTVGSRFKGNNGAVGVKVTTASDGGGVLNNAYGFADATNDQFEFVAPSNSVWLWAYPGYGTSGTYIEVDDISVKLADADRSVKNKGLIVNGTITRTPVATGSELVGYKFNANAYLEQPYNPDLDFGSGDFTIEAWIKGATSMSTATILSRTSTFSKGIHFYKGSTSAGGRLVVRAAGGAFSAPGGGIADDLFHHVVLRREGSTITLWQDGLIVGSTTSVANVSDVGEPTTIGLSLTEPLVTRLEGITQVKLYNLALSNDVIRKIHNNERPMFQPGAQVTLGGASDAVTALAHDPVTGLVHVGTSGGMSDFSGLVRTKHDPDPVTTKIAAHGGMIVRQ